MALQTLKQLYHCRWAVRTENTHFEAGSMRAGVSAKKIKNFNQKLLEGEVDRIANNYLMYEGWFK